jgi:hypothetical protein
LQQKTRFGGKDFVNSFASRSTLRSPDGAMLVSRGSLCFVLFFRTASNHISASNAASPQQVDAPVVSKKNATANTVFASNHEECIQSIGKMIKDLFHSDNNKVNAALNALYLNLDRDKY